MKKFMFPPLLVLLIAFPLSPAAEETSAEGSNLTTYYVAFLHRGPKWAAATTPETERIQKEHMANIRRMAESGKLIVAGPFTDDGELRGMFIFRVDSLEEARALADADPAVQAGRLSVELHPWLSAKGIRVDRAQH